MLTEAQKEVRHKGLGGSDIPWLLGCYESFTHDDGEPKTAKTLAETKWGQRVSDAENDHMARGNEREPVIRCAVATLLHEPVLDSPLTFHHADHPWMLCHVDGLIGECAPCGVLEIKAPKGFTKLKDEWLLQLQWNLAVTDCPWGRIAWEYPTKDGGLVLTISPRIEADTDLHGKLIELTRRFWHMIESHEWSDTWNQQP